jgi:hypothetical protein
MSLVEEAAMDLRSPAAGPAEAGAGKLTPGASDPDREVPVHAVAVVLNSDAASTAIQIRAKTMMIAFPVQQPSNSPKIRIAGRTRVRRSTFGFGARDNEHLSPACRRSGARAFGGEHERRRRRAADVLAKLATDGALDLPLPGRGDTWRRWSVLG